MLNPSRIFIKLKQFDSTSLFVTIIGTVGLSIIVKSAWPSPNGIKGHIEI